MKVIKTKLVNQIGVRVNTTRKDRDQWAQTTVGELTAPLQDLPRVDADESAQIALDLLQENSIERLLVASGESMIGFLTAEHILIAATRGDRVGALS